MKCILTFIVVIVLTNQTCYNVSQKRHNKRSFFPYQYHYQYPEIKTFWKNIFRITTQSILTYLKHLVKL